MVIRDADQISRGFFRAGDLARDFASPDDVTSLQIGMYTYVRDIRSAMIVSRVACRFGTPFATTCTRVARAKSVP